MGSVGSKLTKWSCHHDGNVAIPEICVNSIDNRCSHEDEGCLRLHSLCKCHWQIKYGPNWFNLKNFHSGEIESAFTDVSNDGVQLSPIDPVRLGIVNTEMFKILGTGSWEVDFESMTAKMDQSPSSAYEVRRLSTPSAAVFNSPKATTYAWYFLDDSGWVKYGETNSSLPYICSTITSREIERVYATKACKEVHFSTPEFKYILNLETMQQRNLSTQKVRLVRRRPVKDHNTKRLNRRPESRDLPSHWEEMKENVIMLLVPLQPSSQECIDVVTHMFSTLPDAIPISVARVQSPFLWRAFKNKQKELSIRYASAAKLNVQKLFHGTRKEYVSKICNENFDWRLHGTNVGQLYGRGAYFSNRASIANCYCSQNPSGQRFMIVAEVIVGEITQGDSSMIRPPENPASKELFDTTVDDTLEPKIFVKYDKQEYCPMYVIEYKNRQIKNKYTAVI